MRRLKIGRTHRRLLQPIGPKHLVKYAMPKELRRELVAYLIEARQCQRDAELDLLASQKGVGLARLGLIAVCEQRAELRCHRDILELQRLLDDDGTQRD